MTDTLMSPFVPGLELSRLFYLEAVKPLIDRDFPGLDHAAALIGAGSEILGFDTPMSSDHHWGPRLMLFLDEADYQTRRDTLDRVLRHGLPYRFRGYSTSFGAPDSKDNNTRLLEEIDHGPVNHRVDILTIKNFWLDYLGFDPSASPEPADWLTFPEQKLLTLTAGAVYHDGAGLQDVRNRFRYYPHDVWLFLLASSWERIGQEEHLMGRAGIVGDEIGSALIGSRLVRDIMRLCFLMEKQYAPYPKWFGTAFSRLSCSGSLSPVLQKALRTRTWKARERHLCTAYEQIATLHNALNITEPVPARADYFFGRPFRVIHLHGKFAEALSARISDPQVKRITDRRRIGNIDLISDSTDILAGAGWRVVFRRLYE